MIAGAFLTMNFSSPTNGELIAEKVQNFIAAQHNYYLVQNNGQRIFKLKDDPNVPPPPKGTEIFVGKLPRDFFEDELVPLFSKIGPIYKLRLMVDFSGKNRGYGFVTYFSVNNAITAVEYLNNYEVRKGCRIGVYKSIDNCRLFMGNIPRDKSKEEVLKALEPYVQGLENVILYKSLENPRENRGFAFLEFDNHRSAAMTRRRLAPGTFFLWEQSITVDWADPLPDVDPNIMGTVRTQKKRKAKASIRLTLFVKVSYGRFFCYCLHCSTVNVTLRHTKCDKWHTSQTDSIKTINWTEKVFYCSQENYRFLHNGKHVFSLLQFLSIDFLLFLFTLLHRVRFISHLMRNWVNFLNQFDHNIRFWRKSN